MCNEASTDEMSFGNPVAFVFSPNGVYLGGGFKYFLFSTPTWGNYPI